MVAIDSLVFHAYAYGTAIWYASRGFCRVWDPVMVAGWFRPPTESTSRPSILELYNIRTDGWCLITLALILISLTNAIPSTPPSTTGKAVHSADAPRAQRTAVLPYVKAIVGATVFHHLVTGWGAYQHYKLESRYNFSMGVGVWGNVWLVGSGVVTLLVLGELGGKVGGKEL